MPQKRLTLSIFPQTKVTCANIVLLPSDVWCSFVLLWHAILMPILPGAFKNADQQEALQRRRLRMPTC